MREPRQAERPPEGRTGRATPGQRLLPATVWLWRGLAYRAAEILRSARADLARERDERRLFLWLPVVFAAGVIVYLSLPREPLLTALAPAALVSAAPAFAGWRRGRAVIVLTTVAVALVGAAAAKIRVDRLAGPSIASPFTAAVTGRVRSIEPRVEFRPRMVLDRLSIERLDVDRTPRRLRVSLAPDAPLPAPGESITGLMRLLPVPGPAAPGDYDPRRAAFFDGVGGSAILFGEWRRLADSHPAHGPATLLSRLRTAIVERIRESQPNESGAVAAALLVGERSHIPGATAEDLRISGLAHILAISGLHMGLVAGTMFFLVQAALAAFPAIALTRPIRKWAAVAALVAGLAYLVISGGSVATVRAYVMAAVMFGAILIDRPALSMRNLAIAAFVVMAFSPESVVEPGFQMSFAAVAALIAVWEAWQRRRREAFTGFAERCLAARLFRRTAAAVGAIALTTIVANLATGPIAAFHFQRIAVYGLLGNVLAMPLVSTIVMPAGLVAMIAMPFGLEGLPLAVMAKGIEAVLAVARFVAELGGAARHVAAMHGASLALLIAGLLWLCIWQTRIRFAGLALIVAGAGTMPLLAARPDIRVNESGTMVAVRHQGGGISVSGGRAGSYVLERWHQRDGEGVPERPDRTAVACDPLGCVISVPGRPVVAHVRDPLAFLEDCARADLVVTALEAPADCAATVLAADDLADRGAHAVYTEWTPEIDRWRFRTLTAYPAVKRPWQRLGPQ